MTGMYLVALACMVMQMIHGLDAAVILDDDHIQLSWLKFKAEHNRNYDEEEDALRKATFENNLKFIIQHNLAYERGEVAYTVGITSRADMRFSDCTSTLLKSESFDVEPRSGQESRFEDEHRHDNKMISKANSQSSNEALRFDNYTGMCGCVPIRCRPDIDYVTMLKTPQVRDQGTRCGSCYSFGAVTATTAALALKNSLNNPDWLSVQQGIDCSYMILPQFRMNNGCQGGFPGYVYDGLKLTGGITLWSRYPYIHAYSSRCDNSKPVRTNIRKHKIHMFEKRLRPNIPQLPPDVIDDIECKLIQELQYGPVTASVCTDQTFDLFLPLRQDMVYANPNCTPACMQARQAQQQPISYPVTHTVTIVGYTADYWLIQNSWGVRWGWWGYMRMARGYGVCAVGLQITRPVI